MRYIYSILNQTKNLAFFLLVVLLFTQHLSAKSSSIESDSVNTADLTFTPLEEQVDSMKTTGGSRSSNSEPLQPTINDKTVTIDNPSNSANLLGLFFQGFAGGIAALFMPCIFPMLPLTVSFFTKRGNSKSQGIRDASIYGLSIIGIYVGLGMFITVVFGSDALNALSTNGWFNFIFFIILVIFAASFLGAFEISLPYKWTNKMETNSDRKGFSGIFFMAATLAVVSFSCTGPIIGTLLVQAATSNARLAPATGMFGFSVALALPFFLFALFPAWLSQLPKSGGWLNSVKVCLGFLELALALKFLSNVDLAYHWKILSREVFLSIWIVISLLLGLYLLGKIRFNHDSQVNTVSVPKFLLAVLVWSFSVYLVPGLWGAPLKAISAFLPPQSTQDFDLYTRNLVQGASSGSVTGTDSLENHKYSDLFDRPLNLNPFFDYREGVDYARKVHKPVLIDFTGHACVNCRKMEANVWTDPAVLSTLKNDFVLIQLYVDDKTELQSNERYVSTFSNREISNLGSLNSDIQATKFNTNSQPFYVILDPEKEDTLISPQGANYNPSEYFLFLSKGLDNYKNR